MIVTNEAIRLFTLSMPDVSLLDPEAREEQQWRSSEIKLHWQKETLKKSFSSPTELNQLWMLIKQELKPASLKLISHLPPFPDFFVSDSREVNIAIL